MNEVRNIIVGFEMEKRLPRSATLTGRRESRFLFL